MNKSDSERIATVMENHHYREAASENEADLIILNTCSVRQTAEDRIHGHVRKWKSYRKNNPNFIGIVTGCVPAKEGVKIGTKLPDVDIFFNIQDLDKLPSIITKKREENFQTSLIYKDQKLNYLDLKPRYQSSFQAIVPISIGCNNFCSYCVVPYARGREKSRSSTDVINECKDLIAKGYKEITLVGQNVNSYGQDDNTEIDFPTLLAKAAKIPGDFWIRFISSHPKDMSDDLINVIAANQLKVTPHIHFAVQSGSDRILKAMNRNYTKDHFLGLVKKIRNKVPDAMISTDAIVGFPGETAKDFNDTIDLFKKAGFNMAYISQYSPRPGTRAAEMDDNISKNDKMLRDKKLTDVLEKIALDQNKEDVGKTMRVLVEKEKNGFYLGKNAQYKTVKFEATKKGLVGQFIDIYITDALGWGLEGNL